MVSGKKTDLQDVTVKKPLSRYAGAAGMRKITVGPFSH